MGVTDAQLTDARAGALDEFVEAGYHGEMGWMAQTSERRKNPRTLWADAQSVIMLGCNYGPDHNPLDSLKQRASGNVSVYARGRDYHDVLKGRLKQIASRLAARTGWQVKVFVDTAPLMEKPLAAAAGIGWQGKHTNLVSRDYGSWLFLGAIVTDGRLVADTPSTDSCGSCTACLDICPTKAFPAPYKLDARRCISYLTIEFSGHIPLDFRHSMGNRIFGCDDCLAVCPWNKFAAASAELKFASRTETDMPSLSWLLSLDEPAFRTAFAGSPVRRTGYIKMMRNCLIAAGNSGDKDLAGTVSGFLTHSDARLRAMAVWALGALLPAEQLLALRSETETDDDVVAEWEAVLPTAL
ncbi:MAG: tRNA epoxyqueuosine(34) reductase QueG [Alphaproteobacteria bacterium]|nr:tRNA epoxyqueuosine(34) reductase QueG [Alphaproteobacteria bacterium]MBT5482732.1 tRNA epoxyqueuosine(34) reductase QueG [Alphaproteobacteria bacterium]